MLFGCTVAVRYVAVACFSVVQSLIAQAQVHVGFLVDGMALLQVAVSFRFFGFLLFVSFHRCCGLIHLSPTQYILIFVIDCVTK
jgi:hypothetical protein